MRPEKRPENVSGRGNIGLDLILTLPRLLREREYLYLKSIIHIPQ